MSMKSLSIVAAAALALCAGVAQSAEQIANGGFETVDPNNSNLAQSWLPTGSQGYLRQNRVFYEGEWAMQLDAPFPASWGAEQNSVKDGMMAFLPIAPDVTLSFYAKGTAGGRGDLKVRLVYLDEIGNRIYDSNFVPFSGGINEQSWTMSSLVGPAVTQAGLAAFVQFNLGMGPVEPGFPAANVFIDSLSVQAIPEPSTYALMLAGLAGVGFIARRRRA